MHCLISEPSEKADVCEAASPHPPHTAYVQNRVALARGDGDRGEGPSDVGLEGHERTRVGEGEPLPTSETRE